MGRLSARATVLDAGFGVTKRLNRDIDYSNLWLTKKIRTAATGKSD